MAKFLLVFTILLIVPMQFAGAHIDTSGRNVYKAEVLDVLSEDTRKVEGTDITTTYQTLSVMFLEGPESGRVIEIEDDFILLEKGDKFFLAVFTNEEGEKFYTVEDFDRRGIIYIFGALFVGAVLLLGRLHGLRSLLALAGSLFIIAYVLVPQILAGYSPVLLSGVVAITILIFAIYSTHGLNRVSHAAFLGTSISVFFTIFLARYAVAAGHLTGFNDDAATFLNLQTQGELDFAGLLLGAIIIGVLGVLDDVAITQASAVQELEKAAPGLTKKELYSKALNVGRHHVGALVNTLALAYTGAALPLLLLFANAQASFAYTINREIFATEILRTIIGSMGIILAVPVTTALAVLLLKKESTRVKP